MLEGWVGSWKIILRVADPEAKPLHGLACVKACWQGRPGEQSSRKRVMQGSSELVQMLW
jgi:hypothetical protein